MSGAPAFAAFALSLAFAVAARAQEPGAPSSTVESRADRGAILRAIESQGCATVGPAGVRVCAADYTADGRRLEALSFRPREGAPFPAVLLIPGFNRTARDLVGLGVRLGAQGFAALAVSQPGFGHSEGPADYVGPRTLRALAEGLDRLKREADVDPTRLGVYGFSRGGMAAALLAVRRPDLEAAVLGAGIYDFQRAHDEVKLPGIRRNMETETGMTREAVEARSAIRRLEDLRCPVLILHGEADDNVPVSQALLLRDRLQALGKDFEIRLYPGRPHGIGPEVTEETITFFKKHLAPPPR
jgi:dipeptidyl aminopeptidase/acylaminoacyl peptidase